MEVGFASNVVEIYPLNRYYFSSKEADLPKDGSSDDRIQRLLSDYAAHGMRTCVQGVLLKVAPREVISSLVVSEPLPTMNVMNHHPEISSVGMDINNFFLRVELFQRPHVLLLQMRNSIFILPGGHRRPGESDIEGLKRKLSKKFSPNDYADDDWEVGECIGMWWRSNFETLPYPYMHCKSKECTKLFLVRLPMSRQFVVPRNMKLLAVPLYQLHDNCETYGPIISGIPQLLSKYSFNIIQE